MFKWFNLNDDWYKYLAVSAVATAAVKIVKHLTEAQDAYNRGYAAGMKEAIAVKKEEN